MADVLSDVAVTGHGQGEAVHLRDRSDQCVWIHHLPRFAHTTQTRRRPRMFTTARIVVPVHHRQQARHVDRAALSEGSSGNASFQAGPLQSMEPQPGRGCRGLR